MSKTTNSSVVGYFPIGSKIKRRRTDNKYFAQLPKFPSKILDSLPEEIVESLDEFVESCVRGKASPEELKNAIDSYAKEGGYNPDAFDNYITIYNVLNKINTRKSAKAKQLVNNHARRYSPSDLQLAY